MALMVMAKTDAISAFSRPAGELLVANHGLARLRLREQITVEPYGLITIKDRPLSPAAAILRAEIEARLFPASPASSRPEAGRQEASLKQAGGR